MLAPVKRNASNSEIICGKRGVGVENCSIINRMITTFSDTKTGLVIDYYYQPGFYALIFNIFTIGGLRYG